MKKGAVCMLLLAAILATASCQEKQTNTPETTDPSVLLSSDDTSGETQEEIREVLPDETYDGYTIRIMMRPGLQTNWPSDMFSDGETADTIEDAVFRRNEKVSERLDVNFQLILSSNWNRETDAMASILSNSDDYDIIVPHARASFDYATNDVLVDWHDLPWVDLSKPWWDQDAASSFTINGKLYQMTGDISYFSLAETGCMVFNKKLFNDRNYDYPYDSVLNNTWTFEQFATLAVSCSDDLNGDGKRKPADDLYGYVSYQWIGPMNALVTGGGRIVDKDGDGEPYLSINTERNQTVFEKYFELTDQEMCYLEPYRADGTNYFDNRLMFKESRALFMACNLDDISYLRDMEDDFGIVPIPKFDESEPTYHMNVDAGTNMFVIPITVSDLDRTSAVLEALAAEGYRTVTPAYYEIALQGKYSRDEVSIQMLDIIRTCRVFDLGYYFTNLGGGFGSIGHDLVNYKDHNFASFYAANEKATLKKMAKVLDKYGMGS